MAKLIRDQRKNPETGKTETRYRIGELLPGGGNVTGQLGFLTDREAKRLLKVYEGRRAAGESPEQIWGRAGSIQPTAPVPKVDLTAIWTRYQLSLVAGGASEATVQSATFAWKAWEPMANTDPSRILPSDVDRMIVSWRTAGRSDRTIQIRVLLLKKMLAMAVEEEIISKAPRIRVPRLREVKPHRWLTPDEQNLLLNAIDWRTPSSWAFYLCLQLGLRIGEATSRRWADVDWTSRTLRIDADGEGFQTKTRSAR